MKGALYDLNSMQYPKSEMPWYPATISNWEVKDRLFFIVNNSSIRNMKANFVIYANNAMIESKGLDDIEDVVLQGDWTLSKLKDYSRNWATEAESNAGKEEADKVYGFTLSHRTATTRAFYHAAGFGSCRFNSDGEPEILLREDNIHLLYGFIDTFLNICDSPEVGYPTSSTVTWKEPLENKNAVFYAGGLDSYYYSATSEDGTFSIIPLPKLNDEQERYCGIQSGASEVWSVPTVSENPGLGGLIIEATSCNDYTNIFYKFFQYEFKYRYSSSDKGIKIFELIRDSVTVDFYRIWGVVKSPYSVLSAYYDGEEAFADAVAAYEIDVKYELNRNFGIQGGIDKPTPHIQDWDHIWDDGAVTLEPTHTEFGVRTYTCVCGDTYTVQLEKLPEHEWDDGVVTVEPTVDTEGVKTFTCACGETKTEAIAKLTDSGCGSVVSGGVGMMLLLVGAAVLTKRKKHFE